MDFQKTYRFDPIEVHEYEDKNGNHQEDLKFSVYINGDFIGDCQLNGSSETWYLPSKLDVMSIGWVFPRDTDEFQKKFSKMLESEGYIQSDKDPLRVTMVTSIPQKSMVFLDGVHCYTGTLSEAHDVSEFLERVVKNNDFDALNNLVNYAQDNLGL